MEKFIQIEKAIAKRYDISEAPLYQKSVNEINGITIFMLNAGKTDVLIAVGGECGLHGECCIAASGEQYCLAPLCHENAKVLRKLFPFTAPISVLSSERTVGVGDRLGVACPGHIRVFERYDAIPIFAQQSIRELTLSDRNYDEVLDCVTFSVYREGFLKGFGADGDHLKTPKEVEYAINCGYTMITLDCSEHIPNNIEEMTQAKIDNIYSSDKVLEERYIDKHFFIEDGVELVFSEDEFKKMVCIYGKSIEFVSKIYKSYIKKENGKLDFEVSIDETSTSTTPLQHFFVANELIHRGVCFATLAPRFCGEFQKGIDYIGDIDQFAKELTVHAAIARHFGYKISVHSGSDKFSVFPAIGELTNGRFHLKTAGTNWLEAMKLVAMKDPFLYREIHQFALDAFNEAKQYYHVTTDITKIPDISKLADFELPQLFTQNDARQLIHITYGPILTKKDSQGRFVFRDRLYDLWRRYAENYAVLLDNHIGRHLELLNSKL